MSQKKKSSTPATASDEVRTRSLVIVDKEGQERARLETTHTRATRDNPARTFVELSMLDEKGTPRAILTVTDKGFQMLRFVAPDGQTEMALKPQGMLAYYKGQEAVACWAWEETAAAHQREIDDIARGLGFKHRKGSKR